VTNAEIAKQPRWQRVLWKMAGGASLVLGLIGLFLPLVPTVPFVLLAAWCFSHGSARWERWLLNHPRLGPPLRDWRAHHAVPLRAKQMATLMMAFSSAGAWWLLPPRWGWLPAVCCLAVATWLWRLPTASPSPSPSRSHDRP
jgi:uncharacterized membrane protein YbaN (DUF454 family)